jgi:hypothetical protein
VNLISYRRLGHDPALGYIAPIRQADRGSLSWVSTQPTTTQTRQRAVRQCQRRDLSRFSFGYPGRALAGYMTWEETPRGRDPSIRRRR